MWPPWPCCEQQRHEGLDAVDDAPEVDAHRVLPVGVRRARHRSEERDAGVVADDVHGAEALDGGVGERADLRRVADVGPHGEHLRARRRAARPRSARGRRSSMSASTSRAPRAANARGHGRPDAAPAAGDDGDPVLELLRHPGRIREARGRSPGVPGVRGRGHGAARRCYLGAHDRDFRRARPPAHRAVPASAGRRGAAPRGTALSGVRRHVSRAPDRVQQVRRSRAVRGGAALAARHALGLLDRAPVVSGRAGPVRGRRSSTCRKACRCGAT